MRMVTVTMTTDELWLLIETLDARRESIEHLAADDADDADYVKSLEALETKLREVL